MNASRTLKRWNAGRVASDELVVAFATRIREAMTSAEFWRATKDRFRELTTALDERRASGRGLTADGVVDQAVLTYVDYRPETAYFFRSHTFSEAELREIHLNALAQMENQEQADASHTLLQPIEEEGYMPKLLIEEQEQIRTELPSFGAIAALPDELRASEAPLARVLSLRLFGGWPISRIAAHEQTTVEEIEKRWAAARQWVATSPTQTASRIAIFDVLDRRLLQSLSETPQLIHSLEWRTFERVLAGILQDLGYVVELQQGTKDGGIDIIAVMKQSPFGPHRYLVQAKRWHKRVGVSPVRELLHLQQQYGATKACLATTSTFTHGAWQLEREYWWRLELRDFQKLQEWISFAAKQ